MKTGVERSQYMMSGKRLRKARRRYIRKVWKAIEADHSLLWPCAERALTRGLYAEATTIKHVRFAILRGMSILDGCPRLETLKMWRDKRFGWHDWLDKHQWATKWWSEVPV